MQIDVLTLFPEMFDGPLSESVLKQARDKGLLDILLTDIREFAEDRHNTADDYPYGGGGGMVMKPEPVFRAVEQVLSDEAGGPSRQEAPQGAQKSGDTEVVLLSARGERLDQKTVIELSLARRLVLICGHYKGVDERVSTLATRELSIGDYVLTGGELAAMVLIDAVARLLPGVIGDIRSAESDSYFEGLLGPPVYTRPEEYRGMRVPDELLSGDHARIEAWRRRESLRATFERRPDLIDEEELDEEDLAFLRGLEDKN